ncbi:hypothetical protein TIFTF001_008157 [Ficus carica]|uniref:Uncharacterized protein n=1 Tax=Ficus carica TaxID=3494 RepID=A0AA88A4A2_FICCA|nr:hypothetical protein TIFTF001_008157 [Ficus carica]
MQNQHLFSWKKSPKITTIINNYRKSSLQSTKFTSINRAVKERPRLTKYSSVGTSRSICTGVGDDIGAAIERGRRGSEGEDEREWRWEPRETMEGGCTASKEREWREDMHGKQRERMEGEFRK